MDESHLNCIHNHGDEFYIGKNIYNWSLNIEIEVYVLKSTSHLVFLHLESSSSSNQPGQKKVMEATRV